MIKSHGEMRADRRRHGFTLIELMIVVAVIAVVTAIAIPNLLKSRMAANEGAAVSALRTLTSANQQYRVRFLSYAGTLPDLNAADYIDNVLSAAGASPGKSGYLFNYSGNANTWTCEANPIVFGQTGERYFFVDTSGVIRFSTSSPADDTSPPID